MLSKLWLWEIIFIQRRLKLYHLVGQNAFWTPHSVCLDYYLSSLPPGSEVLDKLPDFSGLTFRVCKWEYQYPHNRLAVRIKSDNQSQVFRTVPGIGEGFNGCWSLLANILNFNWPARTRRCVSPPFFYKWSNEWKRKSPDHVLTLHV